jgi:nucleotide-binding universal stress UspA family protein
MHQRMTIHALVQFDGSEASLSALTWAAGLRSTVRGLSVHVVQVVSPRDAGSDLAVLEGELERSIRRLGVDATAEIISSAAPGPSIVNAAKRLGSDLIVTGAQDGYVGLHAPCVVVTFSDSRPLPDAPPARTSAPGQSSQPLA